MLSGTLHTSKFGNTSFVFDSTEANNRPSTDRINWIWSRIKETESKLTELGVQILPTTYIFQR